MPEIPPLHQDLVWNTPLSENHAEDLIDALGPLAGVTVLDVGCGWAELLLRITAREPSVTGIGVDTGADSLAHGRAEATRRGLAGRVRLIEDNAANWTGTPVDVAVCVGSSHALGGPRPALTMLREWVKPGGRLLLGEAIWTGTPTRAALDALGGDPDAMPTLPALVDLVLGAGWRIWSVDEATQREWDVFESGYARGWERWLSGHPGAAERASVIGEADTHRRRYIAGYRGVLGLAYLVLVRD